MFKDQVPRSPRAILRVSLLAAICSMLLFHYAPMLDRLGLVGLFYLRGPLNIPQSVVVIGFDPQSQREFGIESTSLWPRALQAQIVERLHSLGAKVVALDFTYRTPRTPPEGDDALEAALRKGPVILGAEVDLDSAAAGAPIALPPLGRFHVVAQGVGNTLALVERELLTFHFPPDVSMEHGQVEPLYYVTAKFVKPDVLRPREDEFINFYGGPMTLDYISARELLLGDRDSLARAINNKVVFVGLSDNLRQAKDEKTHDRIRTPLSVTGMPGVEIHATMAANILQDEWIKRLPDAHEILVCALVSIIIAALMFKHSLSPAVVFGTLASAVWYLCCKQLIAEQLFVPNLSPIASGLFIGFVSVVVEERLLLDRRLRAHRAKLFAKFPKEIALKYAELDDLRGLHIVHPEGIVLTTDLEGYAQIRNSLSVAELERMEAHYRRSIGAALLADDPGKRGYPVKFAGDAVTAYFPYGDGRIALERAAAIVSEIARLTPELRAQNLPALRVRIGLAPGAVSCGVRSEPDGSEYFDITSKAGSDSARLESLNKIAGSSIALPGELVSAELREAFPLLYLGRGALNQGDEQLRDVHVVVPRVTPTMIEVWTPLVESIARGDIKSAMALQKSYGVTAAVSKESVGAEYDLTEGSKEHPILSFSRPSLEQFNKGELNVLLALFFFVGQRDAALKAACRSYIHAINHILDPVESTRHLGRALEMLKTINQRQELEQQR